MEQIFCSIKSRLPMSVTNELLQMYALELQSLTNDTHGLQDSSACFANDLGKAHALLELRRAYLVYTTSTLTLVGLRMSNNKTINVWLLVYLFLTTRPQACAYRPHVTCRAIH